MTPEASSPWRDADDARVDAPDPPSGDGPSFYRSIGDFQGAEYRRNAFARHTAHEAAVLHGHLALQPGDRLLDVGCGNGRHVRALAGRSVRSVGLDVSLGLLHAAGEAGPGRYVAGDARRLPFSDGTFDAAMSVSQGGIGTGPAADAAVVGEIARILRPGARVAVTFFHALFAARHLAPGDAFDPVRLVHHQVSDVRGRDGERRSFDLWTSAYTAREAVALLEDAGFDVTHLAGCEPGRYDGSGVGLDDPELLTAAVRR